MRGFLAALPAVALISCGGSADPRYTNAIECCATQLAVLDGVQKAGVSIPAYQKQAAQAAVAIYRDRARTLAEAEGGGNEKIGADVTAYLMNFRKRYEASNDKPAMDRAVEQTLRACAETLR